MENQKFIDKKQEIFYITDLPMMLNDAPSLHVYEICKSLSKLGYNVTLVAPSISTISDKVNFNVKYIPAIRANVSIFFQPAVGLFLLKSIIKKRPDFYYIRQSPFMFFPLLISKVFNVPAIIEVNGIQEKEIRLLLSNNLIFRYLLKFKIIRFIEYIQYSVAKKVITVTNGISNYINKTYSINSDKLITINNGVDSSIFKPFSSIDKRKSFIPSNDAFVIGYVGGFMRWQGLTYVVQSISRLLEKGYNIRLVLVGDGEELNTLKEIVKTNNISSNVIFLDKIPHNHVPEYINAFDLCISYPTKLRDNITSPFKIYEYLACKKAVVTSNINGVGDIFKDYCIIAEAENSYDLENKIENQIKNPINGYMKAQKGYDYILSHNTWDSVSMHIKDLLSESNTRC